jgi:hypothetical protein
MNRIEPNQTVIDESLMITYQKALRDYHAALAKYDYAMDEYEDMAYHHVQVARDNLNNVIRLIKLNNNEPLSTVEPLGAVAGSQ